MPISYSSVQLYLFPCLFLLHTLKVWLLHFKHTTSIGELKYESCEGETPQVTSLIAPVAVAHSLGQTFVMSLGRDIFTFGYPSD